MTKVTNKTLVITDPCYVKGTHKGEYLSKDTIYGDWSCMCYKGSKDKAKELSKEWDKFYFDFYHKYNFTGLEDEEKKKLYEDFKDKKEKFLKENCYGEFCADSGTVAVFDYDSLEETDKKWIEEHPWCACIVPNYTGSFDYVIEGSGNDRTAHIVGDGFYTTQSGF